MKISTFSDDLFELKDFADRLENFLLTEHKYVEGGLVVALTSKYGSGKTTFLNMWKDVLQRDDEKKSKFLVVQLNAWESDYFGDPLFSIISALVESFSLTAKDTNRLVEAAKDLGWLAVAVTNQIAAKVSGIDVLAAGGVAEGKKEKRERSNSIIPDSFSLYQQRKSAMTALKTEINSFVNSSDQKILFLVDELDRCRPDYAISYLETIKHIFDTKGAIFILAADRDQLENSAKTEFGQNLNFEEYFRKFVHREVALPPISESGYAELVSKYVSFYLEQDRYCIMELDQQRKGDIAEIIGVLKLTPRQIQEMFRVLGHLMSTMEDNRGRLRWCLVVGSLLMTALRIGDPGIFKLFASQDAERNKAAEFLKSLVGVENCAWWFAIVVTGGGIRIEEGEPEEMVIQSAGFNEPRHYQGLGQYREGWGNSYRKGLRRISEKIEQLLQWD